VVRLASRLSQEDQTCTDWYYHRPLSVLGSSEFPKFGLEEASERKWAVFKDMFTRYSRLSLTEKADRPVAMGGLEFRLATSFNTQTAFGIVKRFFGESLLWQRFGNEWMEPIFEFGRKETSVSGKMVRPPSWSWMAYTGGIKYVSLRDDCVSRTADIDFEYTNHQCILTALLWRFSANCHITLREDTHCEIKDENGDIVGWIRFDCAGKRNLEHRDCVKVAEGTTEWREFASVSWDVELSGSWSYILILTELEPEVYGRIGVGVVLSQMLSSSDNRVQIF
jgi:hypothetical protein